MDPVLPVLREPPLDRHGTWRMEEDQLQGFRVRDLASGSELGIPREEVESRSCPRPCRTLAVVWFVFRRPRHGDNRILGLYTITSPVRLEAIYRDAFELDCIYAAGIQLRLRRLPFSHEYLPAAWRHVPLLVDLLEDALHLNRDGVVRSVVFLGEYPRSGCVNQLIERRAGAEDLSSDGEHTSDGSPTSESDGGNVPVSGSSRASDSGDFDCEGWSDDS